jgi:hypothetical protein
MIINRRMLGMCDKLLSGGFLRDRLNEYFENIFRGGSNAISPSLPQGKQG